MRFNHIEERFGITISNDFKLFQKLIQLNNPIIEYFDSVENFSFRLTKWLACANSDIKVDNFFESSDFDNYWSKHLEMWGSLEYLPFGTLLKPHAGLLLYHAKHGTIHYTETGSREPLSITSDLYSFVESIKVEYRDDKKDMLSNLYKNWGEDFWRVKE